MCLDTFSEFSTYQLLKLTVMTISDLMARVTTAENAIDAVNASLVFAIQRIDTLRVSTQVAKVPALWRHLGQPRPTDIGHLSLPADVG